MNIKKSNYIRDNEKYILDTSILREDGEGLCHHLYYGWKGLGSISEKSVVNAFFYTNFVKEILSKADVIVLPEVFEEIKQKLRILNGQTDYIKRREINKLKEEDISKLELICQYTNEIHQVMKKCSKYKNGYQFSEIEKEQYEKLLKAARSHSKDLDKNSMARKENYNNPINVGLTKETDKKIVATTYTLAYNFPIYIITQDRGITQLIRRIRKNELNNSKSQIKRPRNRIGIIYYDSYKEDLEKEDIYIPRAGFKDPAIFLFQ